MKKTLLLLILITLLGCTFVDKAKENVKEEVSNYDIGVVNANNGYIYREDGKFYFKEDMYAEPVEIGFGEVATYTGRLVLK